MVVGKPLLITYGQNVLTRGCHRIDTISYSILDGLFIISCIDALENPRKNPPEACRAEETLPKKSW
jgi:hypothetical protein